MAAKETAAAHVQPFFPQSKQTKCPFFSFSFSFLFCCHGAQVNLNLSTRNRNRIRTIPEPYREFCSKLNSNCQGERCSICSGKDQSLSLYLLYLLLLSLSPSVCVCVYAIDHFPRSVCVCSLPFHYIEICCVVPTKY